MLKKEEIEEMISRYKNIMIAPSVKRLDYDRYDKVELLDNYNAYTDSVSFLAVRTRPDKYMINKMYCLVATVPIFEIMRWNEEYLKLFDKTIWEWHE